MGPSSALSDFLNKSSFKSSFKPTHSVSHESIVPNKKSSLSAKSFRHEVEQDYEGYDEEPLKPGFRKRKVAEFSNTKDDPSDFGYIGMEKELLGDGSECDDSDPDKTVVYEINSTSKRARNSSSSKTQAQRPKSNPRQPESNSNSKSSSSSKWNKVVVESKNNRREVTRSDNSDNNDYEPVSSTQKEIESSK
jgi:hypothetical protein